jgi:predicted GH43/DUF377 family glycosyl hydrolase
MKYLIPAISIVLITACVETAPPSTPRTVPTTTSTSVPSPTSTSTPVPTSTPRPPSVQFDTPDFVFQGEDPSIPIVTNNPSSEIRNLYINPGAVLFHDGQFHMLFNSFTGWPGIIEVGYMTSEDGYNWQMVQDAPVFTTDQIPFGDGKADISSAIVEEDGTWMAYFHTVGGGEIGRATAASPLGPWAVDTDPVLKPSTEGWDQYGLGWPSVVREGGEYRMYYGARTRSGYAIGLATSTDGISWTKYNDPVTSDELYAESDPVLVADTDWEFTTVDRPRVVKSPDGWVMIYQAGTIEKRGLAISDDGIHWEKYPANPIFTRDAFPIPNARTWDTNLLHHEDTYYYFMEIGSLSGTDLFLTLHQGTLRK